MKKSNNSSFNSLVFLLLLAAFAISAFLKIIALSNSTSIITYDQGRDLVDIRHMVVLHSPRLVGPTTSINGVLLGPFWYYFNIIPFILSGGNPSVIVLWQVFWYLISAFLLFFSLKRINILLAGITTIFYLLLPTGFYTGRFFWNANAMPLFTGIFIATLIWVIDNISSKRLFWLGIVSGLCLQIEAAFGFMFFPFIFLYFSLKKTGIKKISFLLFGFLLTLIPQLLFEMRHGFQMTKLLLNVLLGHSNILGQKIAFAERLNQRIFTYTNSLRDISHIPERFLFPLFIILFLVLFYNIVTKKVNPKIIAYFWVLVSFTASTFLFYLFFPQALKVWYTLSLSVPLLLLFSLSIWSLFNLKIPSYLTMVLVLIIAVLTFSETIKAQNEYINKNVLAESDNPSLLRNQLTVIDKVYELSGGNGFKVYNYVPSVYDYAYQYLFWWHGSGQYGYQPADIAYLPSQPTYVEDNQLFWKLKKTDSNGLIFLIIENNNNSKELSAWLGNFAGLCRINSIEYPFHTEIRQLQPCQK